MAHATTTLQIRIDEKTKKAARKTLSEVGLDISSAVKLFLRNVVITQSIPFDIRTENGFTMAQEEEIVRETNEAVKHGKRYKNYDEMVKDL